MKNAILIFGLFILIFGCRKDKLSNISIIGTWELRESYGGWSGIKQYEPGNGNLVIFTDKNQYTQKVTNADTSYTLAYKYSLGKEDECGDNLSLQITNTNVYMQRAIVAHDSLTISDGCISDGFFYVYIRQ